MQSFAVMVDIKCNQMLQSNKTFSSYVILASGHFTSAALLRLQAGEPMLPLQTHAKAAPDSGQGLPGSGAVGVIMPPCNARAERASAPTLIPCLTIIFQSRAVK